MKLHTFSSKHAGFSLLEVLITAAIASFALLALAALLLKGIQNNKSSFFRSVAAQQTYDLADRMRANVTGMNSGGYDTVTFNAADTCGVCTATSTCSPAALATYDACTWNKQNRASLPLGQGSVVKNGAVYTITVGWDDNRSNAVSKNFTIKVDP